MRTTFRFFSVLILFTLHGLLFTASAQKRVIKIPGTEMWVALADRWEPHTTGTDFSRRTVEVKKGAYANYQPQPQKPVGTEPKVEDRRYKLVDMAHAVYHAGYVFLPITFENGVPKIHWQDKWFLPSR